ncbi:MAG: MFS transporter [Dongiaceae bacterium]
MSAARLAQIFTAIGHFYIHFFAACYFVIVLALAKSWNTSYDDLISLWTVGSLLVGAGALPAGWLGDRWGARPMMAVFLIGIGASALLCGLLPSKVGLFIGLSCIGLFASIYHPVGIAWLVRNCQAQGKALGLNGVFGNLGVSGAGLIAGALIDMAGWRAAFILPGAISFATGLCFAYLAASNRIVEGSSGTGKVQSATRQEMARALVILLIGMLCSGIIYQGTQAALPKVFEERLTGVLGNGAFGIGAAFALVYFVAGLLQYLGGHIADRYPVKTVFLLCYVLQAMMLTAVAAWTGAPLIGAALLAVTLSVGVFPAENILFVRFTPERHRSLAFGIRYVIGFGTAPVAIQLISHLHGATGGFYWLFMLMTALAGFVALAALALPGDRPPPAVAAAE